MSLGEVITLQRGFDLPTSERKPGPFPIISSSGVSGHHYEARAMAPGVVTGRYGTIGQVYFVQEDYWPLNTTLWVKDFKGNDPRFVSYLLSRIDFAHYSDKSSVPGVNRNHLHSERVVLPPVEVQKEVSRLLGQFDDKIDLNRRMNQTIEELARALFKSWFVDFDPVWAKVAGRKPWGMDAKTAALFPDEIEVSESEEIPKGWKVVSLLDIATLLSGGTPATDDPNLWNGGIPWASGKDVAGAAGGYLLETERTITQSGMESSATKLLPEGTVIMTARGTVGALAILSRPMCMSQTSYGLKARNGVGDEFLRLTVVNAVSGLQQQSYGTIFDTVTTKNLRATQVLLPSQSVLRAFSAQVGPLMKITLSNLKQSRILADARNALLPKLLSGEIRLPLSQNSREVSG